MRAAVLAEARRWIGTPYRHQAACRGVGADCLGLVRGVWRACHGTEPLPVPAYTPDWGEAARDEVLWRALASVMPVATGPARPGEVLLFRMRPGRMAKHLGILAETGPGAAFIHAYSGAGVVQSPLSQPWARRIVARFDLVPGDLRPGRTP